jgi:hypothetical protein
MVMMIEQSALNRWAGFIIVMTGIIATVVCGWYLDRFDP